MSDVREAAEQAVQAFLGTSGFRLAFWRNRLDEPAARALRAASPAVRAEAAALLVTRAPQDAAALQLATLLLADGPAVTEEQLRVVGPLLATTAPMTGTGLAAPVNAWLRTLAPDRRVAWNAVLRHAVTSAGKARPAARWSRQAEPLVAAVGAEAFTAQLVAWMEAVPLGIRKEGWAHVPELDDSEQDALKGLIWAAAGLESEGLAHAVARFAERCFRKIPDHGAASNRLGNACLYTLGALPDGSGVAHLSRLAGRIRYAQARRLVDAALAAAAEQAGVTPRDLEEIAVPAFGLVDGVARQSFGELEAELAIDGGEAVLRWWKGDKPQKSVPKAVKEAFPDDLKALLRQHKELKELLAAQATRLEQLWTIDRRLPFRDLRARYLDHPVVGAVARRLLWRAETDRGPVDFLWRDGGAIGLAGPVDVPEDAEARLWHLLDVAAPGDETGVEEVLVWRDLLEQHGIVQPFAQLWREVYAPEHPAATESRRFAGHVARQHVLRNVLQVRGWRYALQGHWDSHNWPTRELPGGLTVELAVDPVDHQGDDHVYQYVVIGGVRFARDGRPVPLGDVPPRLFSEVLRDVDLFVSSASVANDPTFDPAGIREVWSRYWRDNAFGPLAPIAGTRRAVLQRVLPRTSLRDTARLEGPDLVVDGPGGTFRVHVGSARVRDAAGELVVVAPDRKAKDAVRLVLLPFEGDGTVTDLLAKAFFLARGRLSGGTSGAE